MTQLEKDEPKQEDIVQSTIGNFGRWQLKISVLMAFLKFPIAWFQLGIVFLAPPTQFWCKNPDPLSNLSTSDWLQTLKQHNVSFRQEGLNTGYCVMERVPSNYSFETVPCTNGYDYNRTIFHSSIITEWDLVCDRKRLVDISQITLMLGVLIGNIFFGVFADQKGRKKTLVICIVLQSIFGLVAAWVPWFWVFVFARFLLAVANGGTIITSFVMCMEVVGGKWRTIVPILVQIPFGFGNSIMAGFAYFLRDWRDLQLAISLMSLLFIFYLWLVPESPRWLFAIGRKEEAIAILKQAAQYNNMNVEGVEEVVSKLSHHTTDKKSKASASVLFSNKELKRRTILLCINWLIVGITFYAFSQYSGKVGRNIFLTTVTSGFVALPGTICCVYIISRYGRRWTITLAQFLTAMCFFGILAVPTGVYPQDWPRVLIASIGIVGLSVSLPALYLFTGELFPTTIRNAGVGTTVMFSRLGSMLAPLVIAMQDFAPFLPLVILGTSAIVQALLVLPLPETKGTTLAETVHDLDMYSERRKESLIEKEENASIALVKQISEED